MPALCLWVVAAHALPGIADKIETVATPAVADLMASDDRGLQKIIENLKNDPSVSSPEIQEMIIEAARLHEAASIADGNDQAQVKRIWTKMRLTVLRIMLRLAGRRDHDEPWWIEWRKLHKSLTSDPVMEMKFAGALEGILTRLHDEGKTIPGDFEQLYRLHEKLLDDELGKIVGDKKLVHGYLKDLAAMNDDIFKGNAASMAVPSESEDAASEIGKTKASAQMAKQFDVDDSVKAAAFAPELPSTEGEVLASNETPNTDDSSNASSSSSSGRAGESLIPLVPNAPDAARASAPVHEITTTPPASTKPAGPPKLNSTERPVTTTPPKPIAPPSPSVGSTYSPAKAPTSSAKAPSQGSGSSGTSLDSELAQNEAAHECGSGNPFCNVNKKDPLSLAKDDLKLKFSSPTKSSYSQVNSGVALPSAVNGRKRSPEPECIQGAVLESYLNSQNGADGSSSDIGKLVHRLGVTKNRVNGACLAAEHRKRSDEYGYKNGEYACAAGAKGAECECRKLFDADPHFGAGATGSKLWQSVVESDPDREGGTCAKDQATVDAHRRMKIVSATQGESSELGLRATFISSVVVSCRESKDPNCLQKAGLRDVIERFYVLTHFANKGLYYHLLLGQAPPACAALNPSKLWVDHARNPTPDGFDDQCRTLSSKDPSKMNNLDRFQIFNSLLYARSIANAATNMARYEPPADCAQATPAQAILSQGLNYVSKTAAIDQLVQGERDISVRDGRPLELSEDAGGVAFKTAFPTASQTNGLSNNLLRCTQPGQLGWAFREAERQLREKAISACGSVEAKNFDKYFAKPEKLNAFAAKYQVDGFDLLSSDATNVDMLKKFEIHNCRQLKTRTDDPKQSRVLFEVPTSRMGASELYPMSNSSCANTPSGAIPAGKERAFLSIFKAQRQKLFMNDVFSVLSRGIKGLNPDAEFERRESKDSTISFDKGLLEGMTLGSCRELVDLHRVMMYFVLDRASFAASCPDGVCTSVSGEILH